MFSREFLVGAGECVGRVSRRETERLGTEQQHERESNNSWVRACTGRVFVSVCQCVCEM